MSNVFSGNRFVGVRADGTIVRERDVHDEQLAIIAEGLAEDIAVEEMVFGRDEDVN